MELRSLEEDVREMTVSYEALRRANLPHKEDALIRSLPPVLVDDKDQAQEKEATISAAEALSRMELLREKRNRLAPKMIRYRKRLTETDPVTGNPRYGTATMARVTSMLGTFDALSTAIGTAFGEDDAKEVQNSPVVVDKIRLELQRQEEIARQEQLAKEKRKTEEEAARKTQEELRLEQERQAEEAAELSRRRQQEELSQRAQQLRRARQDAEHARLEQERRAREEDNRWMSSIIKGPEGVRQQLEVLRDTTDSASHTVAINALHTLFSQIVSHPEEVKFRRVRRDHPKFHEDIGRHAGGREILIAAGFRLTSIDDTPCFISTEPNIETDMDGWAEWFDLLKATLGILEEEPARA